MYGVYHMWNAYQKCDNIWNVYFRFVTTLTEWNFCETKHRNFKNIHDNINCTAKITRIHFTSTEFCSWKLSAYGRVLNKLGWMFSKLTWKEEFSPLICLARIDISLIKNVQSGFFFSGGGSTLCNSHTKTNKISVHWTNELSCVFGGFNTDLMLFLVGEFGTALWLM